jgi:WD40 repeat protein
MFNRIFAKRSHRVLLVCGIAVVAGLTIAHAWLRSTIATQLADRTCIQSGATSTCYQPKTLSHQAITAIAISPNGRLLVSGSRQVIQVWDLATGTLQSNWQGHDDWITALAVSPDNRTLASSSLDQTLKLWNLQTGDRVATIHSGRITSLSFSPNGRWLAGGSRIGRWTDGVLSIGGVQIWTMATRRLFDRIGKGSVNALAFSPDGQQLALGKTNTQIWLLRNDKRIRTLNSGELTSLVFSRDGRLLITGSSKTKIWRMASGTLMRTLNSSSSDLALSHDGRLLAAASGGTIHLWQSATWDFEKSLRASWYSGLFIAFGLGDRALVSGSSDGIKLWRSAEATAQISHSALNLRQTDRTDVRFGEQD